MWAVPVLFLSCSCPFQLGFWGGYSCPRGWLSFPRVGGWAGLGFGFSLAVLCGVGLLGGTGGGSSFYSVFGDCWSIAYTGIGYFSLMCLALCAYGSIRVWLYVGRRGLLLAGLYCVGGLAVFV